jgi:HEAT repeat protein
MRRRKLFLPFALILTLTAAACAQTETAVTAAVLVPEDSAQQSQPANVTIQSFTAVEGADLASRLEAAGQRGRAGQTPYWSAYAFDVRPNVAVDPNINEFHGSMNTIGDTSVFVGTSASGRTVETRNLAIFLLREAGGNQVTRMEVYNLERRREYASYPVYWLGRANNQESLNYLRGLTEAAQLNLLGERAVLGIALHDDRSVAPLLKQFLRNSANQRIRSSSVYWLGQIGGEQPFLSEIVRNEAEDKKLRRQAAFAIGESKDRGALNTLQGLYENVKDAEVRRSIVQAAGNSDEQGGTLSFLLKVARTEPDRDVRRAAVRELGQLSSQNTLDELMKIYQSDSDVQVRRTVLQALAETKDVKAHARLLEVAKSESNAELRRYAIHRLAERGESATEDLIKLYESEHAPEMRRIVLQSLSEIETVRVEDKLFAVARADADLNMRRQAIRLLGERAGSRALDFLSATAQGSDGNAEVQMQAVRAISERKAEEAVPILIKIAKTHPNQLVRKQAIRALGESGDPRAVEFFREVLSK